MCTCINKKENNNNKMIEYQVDPFISIPKQQHSMQDSNTIPLPNVFKTVQGCSKGQCTQEITKCIDEFPPHNYLFITL